MADILLLDDEALLRQTQAEILRAEGFSVAEAANGPEALRLLQTEGARVLVADRTLKGGESPSTAGAAPQNGFDVAQAALAAYPNLRVIYTTGLHAALKRRELSSRERALPKPFAASQLLTLVRQLM